MRYAAHLIGAGAVYLSVPPNPERRARMIAQFAPRLVVVFPETAELLPTGQRPGRGRRAGAGRLDPARRPRRRRAGHPAAQPRPPRRPRRGDLLGRDDRRAQGQQARLRALHGGGRAARPRPSAASWPTASSPTSPRSSSTRPCSAAAPSSSRTTSSRPPPWPRSNGSGSPTCSWSSRSSSRSWTTRDVPDHDLTSLRALTHIGATAAPVLRRRARERLGPVIAHTYGASEMGIVSALGPAEHDRPTRFRCAGHDRARRRRAVPPRRRRPRPARGADRGALPRDGPGLPAPRRRRRPSTSSTAGTAPATSAASTTRACCGSTAAPSTSRRPGRHPGRPAGHAVPAARRPLRRAWSPTRTAGWRSAPSSRGPVAPSTWTSARPRVSVEHGVRPPLVAFAAIPLTEQGKPDRAAIGAACAPARA